MRRIALLGLVSMLAVAGCGESGITDPTDPDPGPGEPEPEPDPAVPTSIQLTSPQDSVALGTDTVQLEAVVRDQDGNVIEDVEVEFVSEKPDVLQVLEDGRVIAPWDTTYFSSGPNGPYVPFQKLGTLPETEGPKPVTIRAFVQKDRSIEDEVEMVQNSPVTYVNVRPDGTCMAVGYYTTGERIHTDATVYARDYIGRRHIVGPDRLTWEAGDLSIIQYEIHPDNYQKAKVWGIADGKTYLSATVNGLTNKLTVLSSTKTDEHGNVSCEHLQ